MAGRAAAPGQAPRRRGAARRGAWEDLAGPVGWLTRSALLAGLALLLGACVSVRSLSDAGSPDPTGAHVGPGTPLASDVPAAGPGSTGTQRPAGEGSRPGGPAVGTRGASLGTGEPPGEDETIVGYIALDEDLPYVRSVSAGIAAEAERAGVRLVSCDSDWSRDGALRCAEALAEQGVEGLIAFQGFADLGATVCETVGGVPTLGVVFDQGPCQVSLLDIDQGRAGRLAGEAVGRFARQRWDCESSAYVTLTSSAADREGTARMRGYREGFSAHCPLPATVLELEGADRVATAERRLSGVLDDLKGRRVIVVGLNEDAIIGAMVAAEGAGRGSDVWYSGQLADPSIRRHIACDRHYIASVAQFPERYGALLVPALLDAMRGLPVPRRMEAPLELVTAENVRRLYPDTERCDE